MVAIAFMVAAVALMASATEGFVPPRDRLPGNQCGGTTSIGSVSSSPISGGPRCSSELWNAQANNNNDDDDTEAAAKPAPSTELVTNDYNDDDYNDNDSGLSNQLLRDTKDLVVGDWIVAKKDVPAQGIRSGAVYKLLSMYLKGASGNEPGLGVEIVPLDKLGDAATTSSGAGRSGYTTYLRVWNPRDHGDGDEIGNGIGIGIGIGNGESESENDDPDEDTTAKGVVVTPEEIGLVSLKADWTEAALLAVPGFVWVVVAMSFSNYYTDRYGGSFWDAFFRT
eukprot:CAMPEP_0172377918 /NCGR_PEP_ID=MMETSP1060-20121228/69157_1 /TAXON_ID=37318 /ORGANISM="Pseudo-nitzschia pungens, Strain cf. cingulata" /LENGTH=280 /DNA_ID=CAMNT_0013105629 /DNA_START=180 /DNA_END=1022 /DNA_ORIENTATION=+